MPRNKSSHKSSSLAKILIEQPQSPSVAVVVMVGVGSRYEDDSQAGISHFLEHMVFKGTTRRPNTVDIASAVDGVGGEFNAFTGKEYTGFYIKTAAKDVDLAIDLLGDMLFHSKFEAEEIERERGVILEEMNMYMDSPRDRVGELYDRLAFPDQPLGREIIGSKSSLANMDREQIVAFRDAFYTPNNLVVGVVGDFDKKIIEPEVDRVFFTANSEQENGYKPAEVEQGEPQLTLFTKETDQTHLVLGVRGFALSDSRRYALQLLNVMLGGNMSSRLFTQVRERRGLAYAVHTGIDSYLDAGLFNCQVGLDHGRVEETISVILEQFALIRDERVEDSELQRAKNYMRGKLSLSLEDPLGLNLYLTRQQLLQNRILTAEQHIEKLEAVTADEVQAVAKEIFQADGLNMAAIGPQLDRNRLQRLLAL